MVLAGGRLGVGVDHELDRDAGGALEDLGELAQRLVALGRQFDHVGNEDQSLQADGGQCNSGLRLRHGRLRRGTRRARGSPQPDLYRSGGCGSARQRRQRRTSPNPAVPIRRLHQQGGRSRPTCRCPRFAGRQRRARHRRGRRTDREHRSWRRPFCARPRFPLATGDRWRESRGWSTSVARWWQPVRPSAAVRRLWPPARSVRLIGRRGLRPRHHDFPWPWAKSYCTSTQSNRAGPRCPAQVLTVSESR